MPGKRGRLKDWLKNTVKIVLFASTAATRPKAEPWSAGRENALRQGMKIIKLKR